MATFFTPWLMLLQWNRNPILTTRRRRRQRRRRQLTWKYIYDSDRDKVLTWKNKQYVYPTRKKVNGHWKGIPLHGHWHGSSLRQPHMNHNNLKMESMENKWHHHAATLDTHTSKPQHPQAAPTNKGHPTLATNQTTTPATNTMDTTHSDNQRGKQHQHNTNNGNNKIGQHKKKNPNRPLLSLLHGAPSKPAGKIPQKTQIGAFNGNPKNDSRSNGLGNIWTRTWPSQKCAVSGMLNLASLLCPCAAALYALWGGSHMVRQISLAINWCL